VIGEERDRQVLGQKERLGGRIKAACCGVGEGLPEQVWCEKKGMVSASDRSPGQIGTVVEAHNVEKEEERAQSSSERCRDRDRPRRKGLPAHEV